jgi:Ca2+-transporting ATPase
VMILTDDNFATIVKAVEQGRALYDNLLRYIRFQMASLFGFIVAFLGSSIFNILGGVPFLPLQTLWMNFTTTVFMAVGLGFGQAREGLMNEAPRPKDQRLLPRPLMAWLIFAGAVMGIITLGVIVYADRAYGEAAARTMGVTTFSIFNIFFALETMNEERTLFSREIFENPMLIKMTFLSVVATILATEFGLFQRILDTVPLTIDQWIICIAAGASIVLVAEIKKALHLGVSSRAPAATPVAASATAS